MPTMGVDLLNHSIATALTEDSHSFNCCYLFQHVLTEEFRKNSQVGSGLF
jgi:hypothetical protein